MGRKDKVRLKFSHVFKTENPMHANMLIEKLKKLNFQGEYTLEITEDSMGIFRIIARFESFLDCAEYHDLLFTIRDPK